MAEVTREQWEAKGLELFGPDKEKWKFLCPSCGNEMSVARARAEFPELKGRDWAPEQECVGRYTGRLGCDWAAYGLIGGPLFVKTEKNRIPAFDFAGKPFTSPEEHRRG